MDPLMPSTALFPLHDCTIPSNRPSSDVPYGLTLVCTSPRRPELDLTDVEYDPVKQTITDRDRMFPVASGQQINTPYDTVHDHSRWKDNKPDSFSDR